MGSSCTTPFGRSYFSDSSCLAGECSVSGGVESTGTDRDCDLVLPASSSPMAMMAET